MIQQVERFQPELHSPRRAERDQPRDRQVDVPVGRTDNGIARQVAELAGRRLREGRRVEPVGERLPVKVVAHLVRPLLVVARRPDAGQGVVASRGDVQAVA